MSFEKLDFKSLLHDGFAVERDSLLEFLTTENRISRYAERALLTELVHRHLGEELPEVTEEEVQALFERRMGQLDLFDESELVGFLDACKVTPEEVGTILSRRLRVQKYVDSVIRKARASASTGESFLAQAFADNTLRSAALQESSVRLLAEQSEPAVTPEQREVARRHLIVQHGCDTWAEVEQRLVQRWGLTPEAVERQLDRYARALRMAVAP